MILWLGLTTKLTGSPRIVARMERPGNVYLMYTSKCQRPNTITQNGLGHLIPPACGVYDNNGTDLTQSLTLDGRV